MHILTIEQALSVVLPQFLDWVDIMVAEVSDATCTTHFPQYDYCDILFSTLCLHKKIVGSDIDGTYIF